MMITKRRTVMEGRIEPAFESSNDKNHDEDLLHTITLLA